MNNKPIDLDGELKSRFSAKSEPPRQLKAKLREALCAAARRREGLRALTVWAVLLLSYMFAAALILTVWAVAGNFIGLVLTAPLLLSAVCGAAVTAVCQIKFKGEASNVANVVVDN